MYNVYCGEGRRPHPQQATAASRLRCLSIGARAVHLTPLIPAKAGIQRVARMSEAICGTPDFAGAHPGYEFWVYRPNAALARSRTAAGMLSVCATRRSRCSPGSGSRSTFRRWISATKSGSFTMAWKAVRRACACSAGIPGGASRERPIALPLA